jgi:hypothetical protein
MRVGRTRLVTRSSRSGGTPGRGRWRALLASLALLALVTVLGANETEAGRSGCDRKFGPYKAKSWPDGCWRPYNASSPFNRSLPANPTLLANSSAIVQRLVGWGEAQNMLAANSRTAEDYYHPLYYSRRNNPRYKVRCTQWKEKCEIHGARVRIPRAAKPASASDGHLAVIDQRSGIEYDFWQVQPRRPEGGKLFVSHGGKTRIDGKGLGSAATAAEFGLAAGVIRGEEMLAGEINHALFATIRCSSGKGVYPAARGTSGAACSNFGLSNRNAPPLGARLWLAMSDAQIEGLGVPAWKETILKAMATYGMLIGDTMNGNGAWGIQPESGASYTSFGAGDPWGTVGRQANVPTFEGAQVFDLDTGVDWARYLRVVAPCVSRGGCPHGGGGGGGGGLLPPLPPLPVR